MAPPPPPGSAEKHKGKARRSEYVGVCWDKRDCKWAAIISHEGKPKRKGRFSTEEEAARAFDDAALTPGIRPRPYARCHAMSDRA